ncbi:MAG: hypothetical protein WAV00_09675 [Nocardioides sp.]
MSGDQPPPPGWGEPQVPPPGWEPPPTPAPQPGWGQFAAPGQSGWQPYPQQPPPAYRELAAHKPGAIPLRPLGLGDLYDGAFKIIRFNPKATIGAAVLVAAVATLVPALFTLLTGSTGGLSPQGPGDTLSHDQLVGLVSAVAGLLIGGQLRSIGLLYVSGMVAHVTSAAAVGRTLTIGEAWAATRGKRWRLLGMSVLLGLVGLVAIAVVAGVILLFALNTTLGTTVLAALILVPVLVVFYALFTVRVRALAVPALMLEPAGVFGAVSRAVRLSARQFWRLLGLLLLTALVVGFAGSILGAPFTIAGQLLLTGDSSHGLQAYVLLTSIGTVLTSAVLQPFSAAVVALLYIDQRIRKEAYDVELLSRAGAPVP